MSQRKIACGSVFVFIVLAFLSSSILRAAEQQTAKEEIAIVTYYPVPYGDYDQFMANRLAIGDMNDDGQQSAEDIPKHNGQIAAAKSVIFKPQSSTVNRWGAGTRGEVAYSGVEDDFYYYNGSEWVPQGGRGGSYVAYGTTECADGWSVAYTGVVLTGYYWFSGSSVCKAGTDSGPGFTSYPTNYWWMWGVNKNLFYGDTVTCAVCVK